jgi:outer membrane murein-binding lipoprotein Lpp
MELMERMGRSVVVACVTALVAGTTGCATRGDIAELGQRIDAMNASVKQMESRVEAAERTAQDALRQAKSAEDAATDATRRSEAIFEKSVRKGK